MDGDVGIKGLRGRFGEASGHRRYKRRASPECRGLSVSLYLEFNVLDLYCVTLSEPTITLLHYTSLAAFDVLF